MLNLSGIRRFISALCTPLHATGKDGGLPDFFDTWNSTAANVQVQVSCVGSKFTITALCEQCQKAKPAAGYIFNAADENLAIAASFVLADFGKHCAKVHG